MMVALDFLLTEVAFGWQNWFLHDRSNFFSFWKAELSFSANFWARSVLFPKILLVAFWALAVLAHAAFLAENEKPFSVCVKPSVLWRFVW